MTRDFGQTRTNRRKFLRSVAAAGGLAAVAGATHAAVTAPAAEAAPKPAKPAGYRVTAHVSKYYDKARM
jgi:nitrous oxide reductase